MRASAVNVSEGSVVPGGKTSTATAHLDEENAATYEFDLVWDLPAVELPDEVAGRARRLPGRDAAPGS